MTKQSDTHALIERYLVAHCARDTEAMTACVSDDVIHDVNQSERRHGKDRFHAFCARMAHHYNEDLEGIVILVSEDGVRAAAEFNVNGTYLETEPGLPPATGQSYAMPGGIFFAVRDDKIARITMYYNLTEWIMQVSQDTP
ncbi:MAG: ketosteroid isomerase-related protein [Hyphomicrobiaceae bacterium]